MCYLFLLKMRTICQSRSITEFRRFARMPPAASSLSLSRERECKFLLTRLNTCKYNCKKCSTVPVSLIQNLSPSIIPARRSVSSVDPNPSSRFHTSTFNFQPTIFHLHSNIHKNKRSIHPSIHLQWDY
jgi:hypothetical protein